jgi:hypothetical protein
VVQLISTLEIVQLKLMRRTSFVFCKSIVAITDSLSDVNRRRQRRPNEDQERNDMTNAAATFSRRSGRALLRGLLDFRPFPTVERVDLRTP